MGFNASFRLALDAPAAFDGVVEELTRGLAEKGIILEARENANVLRDETRDVIGKVLAWRPGIALELEWQATNWKPARMTKIKISFEPDASGTIVSITSEEWDASLFDGDEKELAGWFATELLAPALASMNYDRFGDWITDRRARKPSGAKSRSVYKDPLFHRPNFKVMLRVLSLKPYDYLLEVGCGGGAFLHEALESGCRAAAIDHSPDMVELANEANRDAVTARRIEVRRAEADRIPYPDGIFSCAAMTGVVLFLPDALAAFKEIYRVLGKNGRFVLFTGTKETRGTPASPEPIAARLHFYEDGELQELAHKAGFPQVRIDHPDLGPFAREAGLTEEQVAFFSGKQKGSQLMVAVKGLE